MPTKFTKKRDSGWHVNIIMLWRTMIIRMNWIISVRSNWWMRWNHSSVHRWIDSGSSYSSTGLSWESNDTPLVHLKLLEIWIQLWHAHKENSMIWYEPGSQTRMTESSGSENRGLTRPYVPRKMLHGSKNICGSVILRMFCKPGINATIFSSVDSLTLTSVLTGNVSIILNVDTRLGVENFCGRTCLKGTGMSSFRMSKSLSNNECSSNLSWCMHVPQSSPLSNSSSMSSKRNSCLLSVT